MNTSHENALISAGQLSGSGKEPDTASGEAQFSGLNRFIHRFEGVKPGQKLRVCIAVEDIVGPIRNGGIGTTYTHLSRLLSKAGHQVVIAYLRGAYCQNHSIDYWIKWYKEFGVTFAPVDPDHVKLAGAAPRWIRPMYALYQYLKGESFDLVHVSEWRGSAFLCLLAKKQGLAFEKTIFCVKASSPWLWNREYGYQTIDRVYDALKVFAERRSIELADMVVSGSHYLLGWMEEHGYRLPEGRAYVQPNVVVPINLDTLAERRRKLAGSRMAINEIVFFGRLESRKGLDIFFDAVDLLVAKGVSLPPITLMGKYGSRILDYPELSIEEYIRERSRAWPVKVQVLDNFGNEEALRYLLGGNRLAVMPSRIENSTLAVYETAYYGIPFIAADCGGTPELVDLRHRDQVLTEPQPSPLAHKLHEAISMGGFVAAPSFNNDENLRQWLTFHDAMGAYVQTLAVEGPKNKETVRLRLSVCMVAGDDADYIKDVIARLKGQAGGQQAEVVIAATGNTPPALLARLEELKRQAGSAVIVTAWDGVGEQGALNHAAACSSGDVLVFLDAGGVPKPGYIQTLQQAARASDASVFGCFYEQVRRPEEMTQEKGAPWAVIMEEPAGAFFSPNNISPVIAVRKEAFSRLGGFRQDYKIPGALREFVSLAALHGFSVETIPEVLVWRVDAYVSRRRLNYSAETYRTIRPFLESASPVYRQILISACGDLAQSQGGDGNTGNVHNPVAFIERQARSVANAAGSSPSLRNLGWKIYSLNIRVFRKAIAFEIRVFRLLLRLRQAVKGR